MPFSRRTNDFTKNIEIFLKSLQKTKDSPHHNFIKNVKNRIFDNFFLGFLIRKYFSRFELSINKSKYWIFKNYPPVTKSSQERFPEKFKIFNGFDVTSLLLYLFFEIGYIFYFNFT